MSFLALVANSVIAFSGFMARRRLEKSSHNVALAQEKLLLKLIHDNADTDYGRKHDFNSITSAEDYLNSVPLVDYEDIEGYIEELKDGKSSVLTKEAVTIFEPTSGSTSSSKFIPYTKTMLSQFQEAIGAWLYDIYSNRLKLLWGPSYWCVTPLSNREEKTRGGIPVGFDDEGDYFGAFRKRVLSHLTVVPKLVSLIENREDFQYTTLLFLLSRADLTLMSLWSPTFILTLVKPFDRWKDQLASDLESGTLNPPSQESANAASLDTKTADSCSLDTERADNCSFATKSSDGGSMDPELKKKLEHLLFCKPQRAREVRKAASISSLWPQLSFISTWGSATAKDFIGEVEVLFPDAEIQPKGLLSTEGFVSFPLTKVKGGSVLAVNSHFFDFVEESSGGGSCTADKLEEGKTYSVNITTGSGLYRYKTHDRILVTGFYNELPVIDFVGRDNAVADWFGEKLNPIRVKEIIDSLVGTADYSFILVALEKMVPGKDETVPAYCLWIDSSDKDLIIQAAKLESELCRSHHYLECRRLGQLGPVIVRYIKTGTGMDTYVKRLVDEGLREGDVKPSLLDSVRTDWSNFFERIDMAGK